MPKEYIGDPDSGFDVKIGWNRLGAVQIATIDPALEDSFQRDGGLYVSLDRRSINDIIRILRRARDQAFGRDE